MASFAPLANHAMTNPTERTRWNYVLKLLPLAAGILLLAAVGCSRTGEQPGAQGGLQGRVQIDGSSTVYPITEAVAEEFQKVNPLVQVTVGDSGTGGGFKRFTVGETDISDASRPIDPSEAEQATKNNIQFIELPVAFDGISVTVNPANEFLSSISVQDLKRIWEPGSKVKRWSDVNPAWPDREIRLFAPTTDNGTFDYFTEAINGKTKAMRSDYNASVNYNVLVQGVAGDKDGLGVFAYAYYAQNKDKLKLLAIDDGKGPVKPSPETIRDGDYQPLSRPIFIYVKSEAAKRPEVDAFVKFYLANASKLVPEVGYVPLPEEIYTLARQRYEKRKTGSVYANKGAQIGVTLESLLQAEQ